MFEQKYMAAVFYFVIQSNINHLTLNMYERNNL